MSEPSLPDDPEQWPENPYELLGVSRNVNPRDLRRAYTRLIRIYKPEQFPEQFRRIRAAYETVLRMVEFLAAQNPASQEHSRSDDVVPPGAPVRASPPANSVDDADALWELAVQGDDARAYVGLIDLQRCRPERADVALRLYWLLALRPTLEPVQSPLSWLVTALRASGLSGPAVDVFRQELDDRPIEALAATGHLLESPAPPFRLAEMARWRWLAAGRLKRWDFFADDLARLRPRVLAHHEELWLQVQLAAMDHLAWEVGTPVAGELLINCRRELDDLGHLAVRFPDAFDRLDYLLTATGGWRQARDQAEFPGELIDLLPLAWAQPFTTVRPLLLKVLEQITVAPRVWMRHFDALERMSASALAQFGALLAQYQDRLDEVPQVPHAAAELAHLSQGFFESQSAWRYATLRPKLLAFCLRECVGPELIAAVVPPDVSAEGPSGRVSLAAALAGDSPMRAVCWACRLFWA